MMCAQCSCHTACLLKCYPFAHVSAAVLPSCVYLYAIKLFHVAALAISIKSESSCQLAKSQLLCSMIQLGLAVLGLPYSFYSSFTCELAFGLVCQESDILFCLHKGPHFLRPAQNDVSSCNWPAWPEAHTLGVKVGNSVSYILRQF